MISHEIKNITLIFDTAPELFSPARIDPGTLAMLSLVDFKWGDQVLDLGCGYGVVGILAARMIGQEHVVMSDIRDEAVKISLHNAEQNGVPDIRTVISDGFQNIEDKDFTLILSNPPYHSDFKVPKLFIEKGFNRLRNGGKMYMVTKRKDWYKNKFISIFGGVKIYETDGYYVFIAEKKSFSYAKTTRKAKY